MGIALATLAESMPQFALLLVLTLRPMQLVSGPATPRESMPVWLQDAMQIFPTPHFVSFAQFVFSRAATLDIAGPELLMMAIISAVYFAISGVRFPRMLVVLQ
jgi:ABC-2 type transport system permease protein